MKSAPLFEDIAFGPTGGAAHWLTTPDRVRIRVAHWAPDTPKGTVLIFPGRTEYIEKYGDAAGRFTAAGYATAVIDWRGQGIADRLLTNHALGHVGEFADYQTDVNAMVDHVRALGLPEPYYLVAHSMGGCIGLRSLYNGLAIKAAAFSAPMWGIQIHPKPLRPATWILASIATWIGQGDHMAPMQDEAPYVLRETFSANTLTRDPDMWEQLKVQMRARPALSLGGPTLRWLFKALREMRDLSLRPSPATPTITFLGTAEDIVDPDRIKTRMAQWPNGTLHLIDKAEHEVMLEIPATRNFVYDSIISHFDAHP